MGRDYVSIIIPIYNAEKYLRKCIFSVIKQTYKYLEILLINDGSSDNSLKLCLQLQQLDKRIKIINQKNKGASIARLEGIKHSKGQYLSFVDSDDIIEADYIEHLLIAIQKHKTSIAACNMIKHDENTSPNITRNYNSKILEENELHKRFFNYEFWAFWGKIYKKEVFRNIYFPKATINEDYVVMAQLFSKYKQIAYIDITLYHYLTHDNETLSNTQLSLKMMDEWINKLWCYNFYKKNNSKWIRHAEAQVAETCCKLIAAIGSSKKYDRFKREMQYFLKTHLFSLYTNRNLTKGIKFLFIYRIFQ